MALVLLPCDLPSWPAVQRHLNAVKGVQTSAQLVDIMHQLHGLCCVSLDPDENDRSDVEVFRGLEEFLEDAFTVDERSNFFQGTLPTLINYALRLRLYKPVNGLQYSLQQQADYSDLDRKFVASLVANAFFSTFPRRTTKTHPTLQDCNFSRFFVHLKLQDQQKKLRSLFEYFDRISAREPTGKVVFTRKVTPKLTELDLDDWVQCDKLLCPVTVRHDDRAKQKDCGSLKVYFGNSRIGGFVLDGGGKQEDLIFGAFPELFVALMSTERIQPNEAFTAHGLLPIGGFSDNMGEVEDCFNTHVCVAEAMDLVAEERHLLEAAIVRELNKALTAFRQEQSSPSVVRLRPIGKSLSATPPKDLSPIQEDGMPSMRHFDEVFHEESPLNVVKSLIGKNARGVEQDPKTCTGCVNACVSPFETLQGLLGRNRAACIRADLMESNVSRTRFGRPFLQNNRYVSRGDSEESFYVDCGDNKQADGVRKEERLFATGGIMFSRLPPKLSNNCRPRPTPAVPMPCASAPSCSMKAVDQQESNRTTAQSLLDGLTSMEASFVSCYSHRSSSSSSEENKVDSPDDNDDDDVEGYQSCSEELEDDCAIQHTDSRRTTVAEEDLDCDSVSPPMWGRRVECGPVNCRRMKASMSCTTTNTDSGEENDDDDGDDDNSSPLNTHDSFAEERGLRHRRCVQRPRRAASTGFMLDEEDIIDEEDIFVGDIQLEHEREWLASFRHRSVNPSRSSMSRNDSSRYSFSSDFSSDLEDIYEHFEEKMTEGPVRDDPTFRSRLGDRLKRTLSDSLASFPRVSVGLPRSLSLTEKMQLERMNIAQAKQRVCDGDDAQTGLDEYYDYPDYNMHPDDDRTPFSCLPPSSASCNVGHLVGTADVAIEQNLCDVDENIAFASLPPPDHISRRLVRLPSQLSVWWNYNSVYDFYIPLSRRPRRNLNCSTADHVVRLNEAAHDDDDDDAATTTATVIVGGSTVLQRVPSTKKNCVAADVRRRYTSSSSFLQVPISITRCRRSKSASNYEELAKTLASSTPVDQRIVKSRSLTTVSTACSDDHDDVTDSLPRSMASNLRKVIPEMTASVESTEHQSGLRKWRASFNLNAEAIGERDVNASEDPLSVASPAATSRRSVENLVRSQSRPPERPLKAQRILLKGNNDDSAATACRPIETGNWVYDNDVRRGAEGAETADPQLMALVLWMAASQADAPCVIYHTGGDQRVVKLSIVSRVLLDRRWSVGHITRAILSHYAAPGRSRKSKLESDQDFVDILESLLPKEMDNE